MKSPFKFLDSYTKDDRDIFFGRDREIEELYQKVFESKLLLVYGVSGTGKSSLIHCGLANKFNETDWLPLVIRRGGNMIESLAAEISSASLTDQNNKFINPSDFKKGVRSLYLDHYKPVFFIFDQFEELFIFGDKEERKSFIHIVKTLTESDLQCRIIFVMREEYMAWVTEFEKTIPTFFANRVRIEKMSHMNALEAINEPCKVFNISLEEGFAESLLEKLSPGSTEVELTFLQVFLDKIFRLAVEIFPPAGGKSKGGSSDSQEPRGGLSFTLELLSQTGNVSDLLGSFLDDQISLMDDPDTAMTVLKAFVSGKGTKRPANEAETIDNVRSLGKEISPGLVTELLQTFVNLRVLRDKDDNGRYELRHDALAEKIYEKFSTAEKELLEIRQFIENSYQSYLKRKILLSNDDLIYISNKDTLLSLNPELISFLNESRKQQKAKARTVKRLTAVSFLSFLILICTFGYYLLTKISETKTDYSAIKLMTFSDPLKRLKMTYELWKNSPGAIPKEALLKAFNNILEYPGNDSLSLLIAHRYNIDFDPAPVEIKYAGLSEDNKYLFGYGDSLILIWNLHGKLENSIKTEHIPIIDVKLSFDDQFIGALSGDSILTVWNKAGTKQFSEKITYNNVNSKQIFSFTKENNVISLFNSCDAVLFDKEGIVLQTFNRHSGRVNSVDISPDNNFIATASSDKTINIWYFNTIKKRYDYYNSLTWHRDTVWSASFSENSINIISTSSDHNNIIGNINNERNFQKRLFYFDNTRSTYQDIMSSYAEITNTGIGIIFLSYSFNHKNLNRFYYAYDRYNQLYDIQDREGEDVPSRFSGFVFSENGDFYACAEKDKVYLVDNRLGIERNKLNIKTTYTLMEAKGRNPNFTADCNYLIFTDKEKIKIFFTDISTICKISSDLPD